LDLLYALQPIAKQITLTDLQLYKNTFATFHKILQLVVREIHGKSNKWSLSLCPFESLSKENCSESVVMKYYV